MDTAAVPPVGDALRSTVDFFIGFGSDFFAFLVVAALLAAFAFYFGRDRLIPLIAGIYIAIPLFTYFPFISTLNGDAYLLSGLFVVFAFAGMMAFSGLASFMASGGTGFVKVLALAALTAGLVLAVAINLLPVKEVYVFSEATLALFTAHNAFFWWLLAPLAGVFLLGR